MNWQTIESSFDTLQPVEGGFTNAQRGIVSMPDGQQMFIKVGNDPVTSAWAQKEIHVYKALARAGFQDIPKLIATNNDETGFALEYLSTTDGWQWETDWTIDRVTATLNALDRLTEVPTTLLAADVADAPSHYKIENPWNMSGFDDASIESIRNKLIDADAQNIINQIPDLKQNFKVSFRPSQLVHFDVRRDNCAWQPTTGSVKLVDWNWLHLGDRRIDLGALLVNIYKSGLDVNSFKDRLDRDTLLWLTGYWLNASVQPGADSMSDVDALRKHQFDSAIAAYELASSM